MGGLLKHSGRSVWVGPCQHFDAVDRLLVPLLRDLWPTPVPPSPARTVTWVFLLLFLSWRPYGALLHFKGWGVLASSGSLGGMRVHFITAKERWHTSVKMPCQIVFLRENEFLRSKKHSCDAISVMFLMKGLILRVVRTGDHARNSTAASRMNVAAVWGLSEAKWRSTWRGYMLVAMPMLPDNKLGRGSSV